jgi:hypothetical protein
MTREKRRIKERKHARQDRTRTRTGIHQRRIKKLVIYKNCNISQGALFPFNDLVQDSSKEKKAMKAYLVH